MNEEKLIGGLVGKRLTKLAGLKGGSRAGYGYGIYVTDERIVGSEKGPKGILAALTVGSMLGEKGLGYRPKPGECSIEENLEALKELEGMKDFEIHKEDISEITLRTPKFFLSGKLEIRTSKKEYGIVGIGKKEFQQLKDLLYEFYPSALRIP